MNQGSASTPTSPPPRLQVLVLEPDEGLAAEILSAVEEAAPGTIAARAGSLGEAQQLVVDQRPALFVLDVDATYDLAQEFIYDLRTSHPDARAIILTAIHFAAQREQVAGLGAIHFLEKPFPRADFMTLVEALLAPGDTSEGERFQGTLSDLHIADIIQLKCISGATSMLEFTGPRGEKARVYFENGQVRHATAPGKEGLAAFNEIVDWKGGMISEVPVPPELPRTIELDWQVLLMEAVRTIDESRNTAPPVATEAAVPNEASSQTILVIDDSVMLLSFVKEILEEQNYRVVTAPTAAEGLEMSRSENPDLILLDFILPDMKGDAVCRQLVADPLTAKIPVVYVSGFGSDLQPDNAEIPNVIGALNKPFTSETLINSVRGYLGGKENAPNESRPAPKASPRPMPPSRPVASTPPPVVASSSVKESKPASPPAVAPAPKPAAPTASEDELAARFSRRLFLRRLQFLLPQLGLADHRARKAHRPAARFLVARLSRIAGARRRNRPGDDPQSGALLRRGARYAPQRGPRADRSGAGPAGQRWLPDFHHPRWRRTHSARAGDAARATLRATAFLAALDGACSIHV